MAPTVDIVATKPDTEKVPVSVENLSESTSSPAAETIDANKITLLGILKHIKTLTDKEEAQKYTEFLKNNRARLGEIAIETRQFLLDTHNIQSKGQVTYPQILQAFDWIQSNNKNRDALEEAYQNQQARDNEPEIRKTTQEYNQEARLEAGEQLEKLALQVGSFFALGEKIKQAKNIKNQEFANLDKEKDRLIESQEKLSKEEIAQQLSQVNIQIDANLSVKSELSQELNQNRTRIELSSLINQLDQEKRLLSLKGNQNEALEILTNITELVQNLNQNPDTSNSQAVISYLNSLTPNAKYSANMEIYSTRNTPSQLLKSTIANVRGQVQRLQLELESGKKFSSLENISAIQRTLTNLDQSNKNLYQQRADLERRGERNDNLEIENRLKQIDQEIAELSQDRTLETEQLDLANQISYEMKMLISRNPDLFILKYDELLSATAKNPRSMVQVMTHIKELDVVTREKLQAFPLPVQALKKVADNLDTKIRAAAKNGESFGKTAQFEYFYKNLMGIIE